MGPIAAALFLITSTSTSSPQLPSATQPLTCPECGSARAKSDGSFVLAQFRRRNDGDHRLLAEFYGEGKWAYASGGGTARITQDANGGGHFEVNAIASSGAFKYFAEPHVALVITDDSGRIMGQEAVSGLVMRMAATGIEHKSDRRSGQIKAAEFRTATYAFFAFKFCGWRQTFERNIGENNGCAKGNLRREQAEFVGRLRSELPPASTPIGTRFQHLGWQGVRLR